MRMIDVIERKRDDHTLTAEEINLFVDGHVKGGIPNYQASNLTVAVYFQDMNNNGRAALTMTMVNSGNMMDLSDVKGVKVDKRSTDGVGDTTTLVLAPLVAAVDVPVAKMSGHELDHTGDTIGKLEATDGFHVEVDEATFVELANENKVAVVEQSGNLIPADKRLYALRDVTGTINSIPLVTSSIMSKKIAAGTDATVLDVKTSSGAFMKTLEDAEASAHAMVRIGSNIGHNTMAVISDMDQPLGCVIGNTLELQEAIDTLKGRGPRGLTELVLTLGPQMVAFTSETETPEEAGMLPVETIDSGAALEKFKTFIKNQGDDEAVIDHSERLPQAQYRIGYKAKRSDYVTELVSNGIGVASMMLGAGRLAKEDDIDLAVGIVLNKRIGDRVGEGESLLTIHSSRQGVDDVVKRLDPSITVVDCVISPTLIRKTITE